ncbi:hypothetical protein N9J66_05125 [Gammaproteobacteria bacterium]|nr:hypothetical protein [Gammaproteobacteria bacterium]MDA9001422.1 hypothetical protein [Gammaproteobacteria bacterium]
MLEDESLEEYFKKIKKVCITMHDKKHNLKKFNNKKTVAFVSFVDGVKYSEQPHYLLYSLIDEYFSLSKRSKDRTKEVALIFKQIIKNNG